MKIKTIKINMRNFINLLISSAVIITTLCSGTSNKNKEIEVFSKNESYTKENRRIDTNEPAVPSSITDIIKLYPKSDLYSLEKVFLISFLEDKVFNETHWMKPDYKVDINIKLDDFRSFGFSDFSEVKYKDKKSQNEILFNIIRQGRRIDQKESEEFISRNKNYKQTFTQFTGYKYKANPKRDVMVMLCNLVSKKLIEDSKIPQKLLSVELDNGRFIGYKVTGHQQGGQNIEHYLLTDKDGQYIFMFRALGKEDRKLLDLIHEIGKSEGLLHNDDFYNSFYRIPDHTVSNEKMIAYSLRRIDDSDFNKEQVKTESDKRLIGNWTTDVRFANPSTDYYWSYSIMDLRTKEDSQERFSVFRNNERLTITDKTVYGKTGFIASDNMGFENIVFSYENLLIISYDNKNISNSELIKRLENIQLQKGGYKIK